VWGKYHHKDLVKMAISQESPTEVTAMAVNDEKTPLSPSCVLGVDIKHLLQLAKACVII
jgi:hypothetical protein